MKKIKEENTYKDFFHLLISGNRPMCSDFARKYAKNNDSIQDFYENIIRKALYEVGELWENNKISVATEHLSSAIVEAVLNEFYDIIISEKKISKTVIVACVENEFHPILNDEHVGWAWIVSGHWPRPMHPGLWSTVNLDAVRDKISTIEHQVQISQ